MQHLFSGISNNTIVIVRLLTAAAVDSQAQFFNRSLPTLTSKHITFTLLLDPSMILPVAWLIAGEYRFYWRCINLIALSGHLILVTGDLEKVGKCTNLQKNLTGVNRFSKNSKGINIRRHYGQWSSSLISNVLQRFPGGVKKKVLCISELTQHFQKCFADYDSSTRVQQKMCKAIGLPRNLVFLFQVEMDCMGKYESKTVTIRDIGKPLSCLW